MVIHEEHGKHQRKRRYYKDNPTYARHRDLVHLARARSVDQAISLSQSRNDRHEKHRQQHRPKVYCQIYLHLLNHPFFAVHLCIGCQSLICHLAATFVEIEKPLPATAISIPLAQCLRKQHCRYTPSPWAAAPDLDKSWNSNLLHVFRLRPLSVAVGIHVLSSPRTCFGYRAMLSPNAHSPWIHTLPVPPSIRIRKAPSYNHESYPP